MEKKLAPMKTCNDVISRIIWDKKNLADVTVGFEDRFKGIQEDLFENFDFSIDISSVDIRTHGRRVMPKHRLVYFKFGGEIVWDKRNRTDKIFGSTAGD